MKRKPTGWGADNFDADVMPIRMKGNSAEGSTAEVKVENAMRSVTEVYDAAMPRREKGNPHTEVLATLFNERALWHPNQNGRTSGIRIGATFKCVLSVMIFP
uniref:Uncharacterized protein n=1 Tax=Bracon brevicornis TaxID=1563983 RepID=A0A6V7M0D6_9HYME